MTKYLITLLLSAAGAFAQSSADIFIDFEGGTIGNAITASYLSNCTHGAHGAIAITGTVTKTTVGQSQHPLFYPIKVGGTLYMDTASVQGIDFDHSNGSGYFDLSLPALSTTDFEVGFWLVPGMNLNTFDTLDYIQIYTSSTESMWLNYEDNGGAGNQFLRVEYTGGLLGANISVTQSNLYYVICQMIPGTSVTVNVYDGNTRTLVGTSTHANALTDMPIGVRVGQIGHPAHTGVSHWDSMLIDWSHNYNMTLGLTNATSDPVAYERLPFGGSWSNYAGVVGGIPVRTTVSATITPSSTMSQIQSALDACPSNQIVKAQAGTYSITQQLNLRRDGATLVGDTNSDGTPAALFNSSIGGNTPALFIGSTGFDPANASEWTTTNVIDKGWTRGSFSVTLQGALTGLSAGQNVLFAATNTTTTINGTGPSFAYFLATNPFVVWATVTNVSGSTIQFTPPLNPDFLTQLTVSLPTGTVYHRLGVENIAFFGNQLQYITVEGADQWFVYNCLLSNSPAGSVRQIEVWPSNRGEVRHCDFGTIAASASDAYSILAFDCTGLRVEDNYFHNSPNFYPECAAQNCALAYNFATNVPFTSALGFLSQIFYNHGEFCSFNLYEGNWLPAQYDDGLTDNASNKTQTRNNTWLRSRNVGWDGSDGGKNQNCNAITVFDAGTNISIAGCALGKVGTTTKYFNTSGNSDFAVYRMDANTQTTLGKFGNWNGFNNGINASETLANGQLVATSYLYGGKPGYWGTMTYPWDPTPGTAAALDATNIPAGLRAAGGSPSSPTILYPSTATVTGNAAYTGTVTISQ